MLRSIKLNSDALEFMDAINRVKIICDLGSSKEEPQNLSDLGLIQWIGSVEGYAQYEITDQGTEYMAWLIDNDLDSKMCSIGQDFMDRYNQLVDGR